MSAACSMILQNYQKTYFYCTFFLQSLYYLWGWFNVNSQNGILKENLLYLIFLCNVGKKNDEKMYLIFLIKKLLFLTFLTNQFRIILFAKLVFFSK